MAINFETETIITLGEACRAFPPNGVSDATLARWIQRGIKAKKLNALIKLETLLIGGRRLTSREAIARFIAAQNADDIPASHAITPSQRRRHQQPQLAVLEAAVRSFAPIEPMTLRWNWPLWAVAEDVEPALPKNSKDGERVAEMRARILKYLSNEWQSITRLAERCSTKRNRPPFADILDELLGAEQIELTETYVPPRTKRETTGIRLTSDKTTSDNCPESLSDVRG